MYERACNYRKAAGMRELTYTERMEEKLYFLIDLNNQLLERLQGKTNE